ncbi:MAG: hypothetical protein M9942_01690 [Microthrixaceae bacterium]|nr:hypothetical protein [Microthrixaceae bacterium]
MAFVAEMFGHLQLQTGLKNPGYQLGQQTVLAGQRDTISSGLVDELLGQQVQVVTDNQLSRRHRRHQLPDAAGGLRVPQTILSSLPDPTVKNPSGHAVYTHHRTVPQAGGS